MYWSVKCFFWVDLFLSLLLKINPLLSAHIVQPKVILFRCCMNIYKFFEKIIYITLRYKSKVFIYRILFSRDFRCCFFLQNFSHWINNVEFGIFSFQKQINMYIYEKIWSIARNNWSRFYSYDQIFQILIYLL